MAATNLQSGCKETARKLFQGFQGFDSDNKEWYSHLTTTLITYNLKCYTKNHMLNNHTKEAHVIKYTKYKNESTILNEWFFQSDELSQQKGLS